MANTIQLKRGLTANLPAAGDAGEPLFTLDTKKLYIGTGTDKVLINPDYANVAISGDYNDLFNIPAIPVPGTESGNVPVLDNDGKLPESVIPALAITDIFEAATEAAMLALSDADKGDVCIRSDLNKSFILKQTPASIIANWTELRTPTDSVLSVNGATGTVTVTKTSLGCLGETDTIDGGTF